MFSKARERILIASAALLLASPAAGASRPVVLSAADGTQLSGDLYESFTRPAPAVVLVHVLGRSKEEWTFLAERLQNAGITALAIDLRGHGRSGGSSAELAPMVGDVEAAIGWLAAQSGIRVSAIGVVGASLGANLAAVAAADSPVVRAVAMISPSLDYRGIRIDASVLKKLGDRPVWMAASTEDPYALRSMKEIQAGEATREQRLSIVRAHGTALFRIDSSLAGDLVDWLRRSLIF